MNINITYFLRGYRISSKVNLVVPESLDEIIIGNLLGDGHISRRNSNSNSRFEFSQSIKNRVYVDHLYSLFEDPCFNYYRDLFYKFDGVRYRKIIPENMYYLLSQKALAYWIMDDGSKTSGGGVILCTESFADKDIDFLIEILTNKYNLNCNIQEFSHKKRIYILKESKKDLVCLVKPYILPHFHYKLNI